MSRTDTIKRSLAKLGHIRTTMAQHRPRDVIDTEGIYYILDDVIEEIKEALEGLAEKPLLTPANHAA